MMRNPNYNLSRPTHKGGKRQSFQGPSRYGWPHGGQQYDPNSYFGPKYPSLLLRKAHIIYCCLMKTNSAA